MITYLKIIVIVLGVMIAAGLVVIGIKLVEKSNDLAELGRDASEAGAETTPADAAAGTAAPPWRADLGLPAGAQVRRMTAADHRLVLVVTVPEAGERIVILDLRDGSTIAEVGLEGAP